MATASTDSLVAGRAYQQQLPPPCARRTCGLMFRMLAGHDRFHLNQMRETLRAVRQAS